MNLLSKFVILDSQMRQKIKITLLCSDSYRKRKAMSHFIISRIHLVALNDDIPENDISKIKNNAISIFDMIVTPTYHDKPLIFSRATFREISVSPHRGMRNVVSSSLMQRSDRKV